jgi:uncharacterized protein YjbI with pentapeptide repeats
LLFHFPTFSFSSSSSSSSSNFLCHHDESSALLQIKSFFTKETESYYYNIIGCAETVMRTRTWKNGTDCCSWNGVTCDTISGHVVGLNLGCEGLQGMIHHNSTLFHLAHLQRLDLSNNDFSSSHFPSKFGGFLSLTHLDLSSCYFKGEVPLRIAHLSKLKSLYLTWNDLVWKEATLKRLVQNATNLIELFLYGTDMSSIRPNYLNFLFNQSSSLITLNLGSTKLSGKFKMNFLCDVPSIQEVDMSENDNLEGQFQELSCNSSLRNLDLSYCQFKGSISLFFSNFTHLTSLNILYNNLIGSIPSSI